RAPAPRPGKPDKVVNRRWRGCGQRPPLSVARRAFAAGPGRYNGGARPGERSASLMPIGQRVCVFATAILAISPVSASLAQAPDEFFRGKTIDLYIAYSAGGAYDLYPPLLAPHL